MSQQSHSSDGQRRKVSQVNGSNAKRRSGAKRTLRACDRCRFKKSKCDGLQPCETCRQNDRTCVYSARCARDTRDWYNRMQEVVEEGFQRLYKATKEANVFPGTLPKEWDGRVSTEEILRGMGLRTEPMPHDENITDGIRTTSPLGSRSTEQNESSGVWDNDEATEALPLNWHLVASTMLQEAPIIGGSSPIKDKRKMEWPNLPEPFSAPETAVDMRTQFQIAVSTDGISKPVLTARKRSLQRTFHGALHDRIQSLSSLSDSMALPVRKHNRTSTSNEYPPQRSLSLSMHDLSRPLVQPTYLNTNLNDLNHWTSATAMTLDQQSNGLDMGMDIEMDMDIDHNGPMMQFDGDADCRE